jgi:hypothetical protein
MQNYKESVDKFVCSKTCPCPRGPNGEWEKYWTSVPADTLKANGRVAKLSDLTSN